MAKSERIKLPASRRRGTAPLFVNLVSGEDDYGICPTETATAEAADLAFLIGAPVTLRCIVTDRIIKTVCPHVAGRA